MPRTDRSPFPSPRRRPPLLLFLFRRHAIPLPLYVALAVLAIVLVALNPAAPSPAGAAERGVGFGTWAASSRYGWHGSMLIDGVHTYCITPGAPLPIGPSTHHGISGSAAGLSPQQLAGINLLVSTYGQTSDPVQAAAVAWAVKAVANRDEALHTYGYRGDSLAGAIHWTFAGLAPEHDLAVQQRAVAYYDEAMRVQGGVTTASGSVIFTTDASDHRGGTVRVEATAPAHGALTLVNAVFADTGSATRDSVTTGTTYAIRTAPPAEGRPYAVSGGGHFSAGIAAAVRHFTTQGGQQTAGPAGTVEFDVAGADAALRVPPFAPTITTQVPTRYTGGGAYVDEVTFAAAEASWPRSEDGSYLPVHASAVVYRTDTEPVAGAPLPGDEAIAGTLDLLTHAAVGPTAPYPVTSSWEMSAPGFYTAVWTVRGSDQSEAVALHTGADYLWTEAFGERAQVAVVPAITTEATARAVAGASLTDTILVSGGVPAEGLWISSAVYRTVDGVPPADSCTPQNLVWESAATHVVATGAYTVSTPPLDEVGTYYWQERAIDASGTLVHVGVCGVENETSRIMAPAAGGAALARTGAEADALRAPAAAAVALLSLGTALLASRRRTEGATRPG